MTDLFLKFPDQPTALEVLRSLGMTYTTEGEEPTEQISQGGHQWALWEVGILDGIDAFHVNLRLIDQSIDISSLEPYTVIPKNPRVIWA
jgi:hypothetical protein